MPTNTLSSVYADLKHALECLAKHSEEAGWTYTVEEPEEWVLHATTPYGLRVEFSCKRGGRRPMVTLLGLDLGLEMFRGPLTPEETARLEGLFPMKVRRRSGATATLKRNAYVTCDAQPDGLGGGESLFVHVPGHDGLNGEIWRNRIWSDCLKDWGGEYYRWCREEIAGEQAREQWDVHGNVQQDVNEDGDETETERGDESGQEMDPEQVPGQAPEQPQADGAEGEVEDTRPYRLMFEVEGFMLMAWLAVAIVAKPPAAAGVWVPARRNLPTVNGKGAGLRLEGYPRAGQSFDHFFRVAYDGADACWVLQDGWTDERGGLFPRLT